MTGPQLRIAVAGNPNVGKTSLFNVLTGSRHRVGNYSGVTVECLEGELSRRLQGDGAPLRLIDLPGIYSLSPTSEDEVAAYEVLTGELAPDAVLLVVDASNLARNLYLALQLLELGLPVVVALNMVDVAREAGLAVDASQLSAELGVPVVPTVARAGEGADQVVAALREAVASAGPTAPVLVPPGPDDDALREVLGGLGSLSPVAARTTLLAHLAGARASGTAGQWLQQQPDARTRAAAEQLVRARYRRVDEILEHLGVLEQTSRGAPAMAPSERIDRVLTHRVFGLLIFVAVMAFVFVAIFSWADPVMGLIEDAFGWLSELISDTLGPGLLTELLTDGLIAGVGNVVIFVPQIGLLFLFIGLLEDSGYLARAAFLLDRLMSKLGLHGRAFIPLLSGYACAIPAIMGTRTISTLRDRIVTILMIPYMSCSARLPIYTLVIGALFVTQEPVFGRSIDQGLVLLSMYLLSTVSALAMGFVYKRTILVSPTPPLVLELPPYRLPRVRDTLLMVVDRVADFLRGAGTIILACTVVLWALLSFPAERTGAGQEGPTQVSESYGGRMAQGLEPALTPIGQDWRVGVGIIGSFAAREVLVSTLGLVYGMEADDEDPAELRQALREQKNPKTGKPQHTPLSGLALMVFFVYACQCMSTLAVVKRETGGWKWPAFMFVSMTGLAYVAALVVFQGGQLLGFG
ncbi:MAG: ferrous iron transport protein B [Nannocystaceae bacterium]